RRQPLGIEKKKQQDGRMLVLLLFLFKVKNMLFKYSGWLKFSTQQQSSLRHAQPSVSRPPSPLYCAGTPLAIRLMVRRNANDWPGCDERHARGQSAASIVVRE